MIHVSHGLGSFPLLILLAKQGLILEFLEISLIDLKLLSSAAMEC